MQKKSGEVYVCLVGTLGNDYIAINITIHILTYVFQTVSEVTILVDVEKARAKDVKVEIKPNKLKCMVHGKIIFDGQPFSTVIGTFVMMFLS